MQDHTGRDGGGRILPISLLGAILTGTDDHVGDVLRVRNVSWGPDPNLSERIEAGAVSDFDG
jgi:hypothetical protein